MGLMRGLRRGRVAGDIGSDVRVGHGSRIDAGHVVIGAGVRIGADVVITGDRVVIGPDCHIGDHCVISAPDLVLGHNCVLFDEVTMRALSTIELGDHAKISRGVVVKAGRITTGVEFWMNRGAEVGGGGWRSPAGGFVAGDRCHVGRNSHLNTAELVTLGDDTAVGMDCTIATHAHWQPVTEGFPRARGPVRLGSDVAIYSRSVISPGITIHSGATIAGGSVVLQDVPERGLVAGAPARLVRTQHPPDDRVVVLKDIMAAFADACGGDVIGGGSAEWALRHDLGELALVGDSRLTVRAAEAGQTCDFDLRKRIVDGRSSLLSEAVRTHFFGYGVRFRYSGGYQRPLLSPKALVDAGLED